jgi:hypothetical protein
VRKGVGRDLHQREVGALVLAGMAQAGAQQGGFAHAARSPQQHVMRGVAMGMAQHIVDHLGLLLVHAVDQVERGGLDGGHGARLDTVPHIGGGGGPVDGGGGGAAMRSSATMTRSIWAVS